MITIDNQKQCSTCKEWKPATNNFFANSKTGELGLRAKCKRCTSGWMRKYYEANHEQIKERASKWSKLNPERRKEIDCKWRKQNPEQIKERTRKWRKLNPERYKEITLKWQKQNPEKGLAKVQKRRALKANAAGTSTAEQIKARFQFHENRCYYCGDNESGLQIEHRIPLSRGGSNWPANLVPACPACNMSKHTKTEKEFLQ